MRVLLSFAFISISIIASSSHAAQKCIALDSSGVTPCSGNKSSFFRSPDLSATCNYLGQSTSISAIAICSSDVGAIGDTLNQLTFGAGLQQEENLYCWCKMVAPAVSKWVYVGNYTNVSGGDADRLCTQECADFCIANLENDWADSFTEFRRAMFSTISN